MYHAVEMEEVWSALDRLVILPGGIDVPAAAPPTPGAVPLEPVHEPIDNEPSLPRSSGNDVQESTATESDTEDDETDIDGDVREHEEERVEVTGGEQALPIIFPEPSSVLPSDEPAYVAYEGRAGSDPRPTNSTELAER